MLKDGKETNTFAAGVFPSRRTEQVPADRRPRRRPRRAPILGGATASRPHGRRPARERLAERSLLLDGRPGLRRDEGRRQGQVRSSTSSPSPPRIMCQAGNVVQFGKDSSPVLAGQGTPYASGLSPRPPRRRERPNGSPSTATRSSPGRRCRVRPATRCSGRAAATEWRANGSIETEGTAAVCPSSRASGGTACAPATRTSRARQADGLVDAASDRRREAALRGRPPLAQLPFRRAVGSGP